MDDAPELTDSERLRKIERDYAIFARRALKVANGMRWTIRGMVVLLIVVAVGATLGIQKAHDLGRRNVAAIHVSCVLLSNAIIQSGAAAAVGGKSDRVKLSDLYVRVIYRAMTPAEVAQAKRLAAGIVPVTRPSCADVALHPDHVRALAAKP